MKNQLTLTKRNVSDIEDQKEGEMNMIIRENELLKTKDREISNRSIFMEREIDSYKEENRKLKKDVDNAKSDCDQMLKMIESLQQKLANYDRREDQINRMIRENKEKLEEALIVRDRAVLKEEQYLKALESASERHKNELQNVRDQYERMLESSKNKFKSSLEAKDLECKTLTDENVRLTVSHSKLNKENKTLKNESAKLNAIIKENIEKKDEKCDDYEKQINELEDKILKIESDYNTKMRILENQKSFLDTQNKQFSIENSESKSEVENLKNQNSNMTNEVTNMRSKLNANQKERQNFFEELSKVKKTYETQMALFSDNYNEKIQDLEDQIHEWQKKEQSTKQKSLEMLKSHEWVLWLVTLK